MRLADEEYRRVMLLNKAVERHSPSRSLQQAGCRALLCAGIAIWVCAAGPAHGDKVVAVVPFEGPGGPGAQRAVVRGLSSAHTLVTGRRVFQAARKLGAGRGCSEEAISPLARALEADAVLCGILSRDRGLTALRLLVYNAASGKLAKEIRVTLPRGQLSAATVDQLRPHLDAALALTARAGPDHAEPQLTQTGTLPGPLSAMQVQGFLRRLESPIPADRLAAVSDMARYSDWQVMAPLSCRLLTDSDPNVRSAAAGHMGVINDMAVVEALQAAAALEADPGPGGRVRGVLAELPRRVAGLIQQLSDPDARQRETAARALGQGAYPQGLLALLRALGDPDPSVRLRAVEGLRNLLGDPQARAALESATRDPHPTVSQVARSFAAEQKRLATWRSFYTSEMRTIKKTFAKEERWRREAVIALGISGSDSAAHRLIYMMVNDTSEQVRLAVAWALMLASGAQARQTLVQAAASDPSLLVRGRIAAFLQVQQATPDELTRKLTDASAELRLAGAEAISLRPSAETLPHLMRAVMCDPDPGVRRAALLGMARLGTAEALAAVRTAMFRDRSDDVRRAAMMLYVMVAWKGGDAGQAGGVSSSETTAWEDQDKENPLKERGQVKKKVQVKKKAEQAKPRCTLRCEAIRVQVGPSVLFVRDFGVESPADPRDEQGLTSTPVAGLNVGAEIYPGAFVTRGWWANLGLGFTYARYFGLSWKADNDPEHTYDIVHEFFSIDILRFRFQPVRSERVPTLLFRFGVRHLSFEFDEAEKNAQVPDLSATSVVLGLGAEIPVGSLSLLLMFDFLPVTEWGEMTSQEEYGEGSGWGFQGTAGLSGPFGAGFGWRLDLLFTHYMLDFEGLGDRTAAGATDSYFNGLLYLTYSR